MSIKVKVNGNWVDTGITDILPNTEKKNTGQQIIKNTTVSYSSAKAYETKLTISDYDLTPRITKSILSIRNLDKKYFEDYNDGQYLYEWVIFKYKKSKTKLGFIDSNAIKYSYDYKRVSYLENAGWLTEWYDLKKSHNYDFIRDKLFISEDLSVYIVTYNNTNDTRLLCPEDLYITSDMSDSIIYANLKFDCGYRIANGSKTILYNFSSLDKTAQQVYDTMVNGQCALFIKKHKMHFALALMRITSHDKNKDMKDPLLECVIFIPFDIRIEVKFELQLDKNDKQRYIIKKYCRAFFVLRK